MTLQPPADAQPEVQQIPPSTAELLAGMDEEQAALALGLGVLVQRAAAVEYTLHGLYAHLGDVERPYTDNPHESVTHFIKKAKSRLAAIPEERIPTRDRTALLHDLDRCTAGFEQRNRYIHGYWAYDEETYAWRIVKGTKGLNRPEITVAYSEDVWELADEFNRLHAKLIAWDAHFFGTPGNPALGEPPASSKRL
ncbi:hypothetical protein ABZ883_42640 [Streptomyces sp. NPDC046977]|uniref:hypothetical protein n=1 Tax=Streptomyces sp. NPDC046977 TaxID=3154703 RepID=UPI0033FE31D2